MRALHMSPVKTFIIVGEDSTGGHQNDVLWYLDLTSPRTRRRIVAAPFGASITSNQYYIINEAAYITVVVTHPHAERGGTRLYVFSSLTILILVSKGHAMCMPC